MRLRKALREICNANGATDGVLPNYTDLLTGEFVGVRSGNLNLREEEADTETLEGCFNIY